jgi:ATP-dependent RNA helicase DeaD
MSYVDWPPLILRHTYYMAEFETTFADLGLKAPILEALNDLGYEKPSPIQAECIPHLLGGATFWVWPRRVAVKPQRSLYRC